MSKKTLNRGNEPKDLLQTQHLAIFGAKNEPKTNSILSARRAGFRFQVSGVRDKRGGFGCQGLGAGARG
jgi:hypothetical protein